MDSITEWLSIAEKLGVGATFVLGIVSIFLWKAIRNDHDYLRQRDKETLTVIANLTAVLDKQNISDTNNVGKLLDTMHSILEDIKEHDHGSTTLLRQVIEKVDRLTHKFIDSNKE